MTFGAPTVGEVLADRYRLEEHINDDSAGRQVWRGVDVVLRRPVAVVLRYPGGESAEEMLNAAVAASRVAHSNLVGVYDAIDEGDRAYVVREWVDGAALRDYVAQSALDAPRATTIGHAVASAVAAVHATGMVHGNIHPGTVLIGSEGRVVLADARANDHTSIEGDIRAIGATLYFSLTGHWPQAEAGRQNLPDAVRDASGVVAAPRQMRAGVPAYLDELITDLLDPGKPLSSADVLAAELGRLDAEAEVEATLDGAYYDDGPLSFGSGGHVTDQHRPSGRKIAIGVVALVLVAAIAVFVGTRLLNTAGTSSQADPGGAGTSAGPTGSAGGPATDSNELVPLKLNPEQVRIVDPDGDRTELDGTAAIVDGNDNTGWKTDRYNNKPDFGHTKQGMGVLLDLGEARAAEVEVLLSAVGASAELKVGNTDPGSSKAGDDQIVKNYKTVGPTYTEHHGTRMVFTMDAENASRYVMVWITLLPPVPGQTSRFQIGVQEIHVRTSR
jgi:hypothetical protein